MTSPDVLVVASHAKWVYEDFAAVSDIPVIYSHGYDLPNLEGFERPAVWTSTAHAARMKHAGMSLPLVAPGPEWLPEVPKSLRGRPVGRSTFFDLRHSGVMDIEELVWIKLAEMKHEMLPAQRTYFADFLLQMESLGAHPDTQIQYSYENLCIVREDRCFILDGEVITSSPYMQLGDIWDYDKHLNDPEWRPSQWAEKFAGYVACTMKSYSPRAYTLDVAQVMPPNCVDPDYHIVLEANPVWSSAVYGADPKKALEAVLAGVDYEPTKKSKLWQPDPWLVKKANTMVRLKV